MSYSVQVPCWNCTKKDDCKDYQHLQEGVNAAHQDIEGHKGGGTILMSCCKCIAKS